MSFHPIEDSDIKYAGAAWKKGAFDKVGEEFRKEMSPEEFRAFFTQYVLDHYDAAFTFVAKTPKGDMATGMFFGFILFKVLFVGDIVWFPWATARNRLEGIVHFVNTIRDEFVVMEHSPSYDKRYWEQVCRYGIMRRVGTVLGMAKTGEPLALFQSIPRK